MPSDMPNLRGALYLAVSNGHSFGVLVVALSAVLFLVAAWNSRSRNAQIVDLQFALAIFATVLVSYHALESDLCVLAIPILLLAGWLYETRGARTWTRFAIISGLAVLLFSPLHLVLIMRYSRLAYVGWALLMCFVGLSGELRSHRRQVG